MNTPETQDNPHPPLPPACGSAARPKTIAFDLYENLRHQYDLRLVELEQAKADRNKAAMLERRKYLPKFRELEAELRRLRAIPPNYQAEARRE